MKKVVVTGGAGQISYSLLFRIANGDLLGKEVPISLSILEIPPMLDALRGVEMELNDCCFPLLKEVVITSDTNQAFEGANVALLVGSKPRSKGMERKDLLLDNGKIFIEQGKAIGKNAAEDIKVLVVGNPCNTNCLICLHHAPNIPKDRFFAMTRLDENRAKAFLAHKSNSSVEQIKNMAIWGNHSKTQVPDYEHATINGKPALEVLDKNWLENEFSAMVQNRGAQIIEARQKSSAASAANGAIDSMQSLINTTPDDNWHSLCVYSQNNPYGIDQNLIFSFPCKTTVDGVVHIVEGIELSDGLIEKMKISEKELLEERDMISHLL